MGVVSLGDGFPSYCRAMYCCTWPFCSKSKNLSYPHEAKCPTLRHSGGHPSATLIGGFTLTGGLLFGL